MDHSMQFNIHLRDLREQDWPEKGNLTVEDKGLPHKKIWNVWLFFEWM